jgi:hypothetical protein
MARANGRLIWAADTQERSRPPHMSDEAAGPHGDRSQVRHSTAVARHQAEQPVDGGMRRPAHRVRA